MKNKANKTKLHPVRLDLEGIKAESVSIAGTFNDWKPTATPMVPAAPGHWTKEMALPPGKYEYLLVVDGQWQLDPKCPQQVPNPYGGMNCVLEIKPDHRASARAS
jgi:1,4-alpha-glucan branching enzyme